MSYLETISRKHAENIISAAREAVIGRFLFSYDVVKGRKENIEDYFEKSLTSLQFLSSLEEIVKMIFKQILT